MFQESHVQGEPRSRTTRIKKGNESGEQRVRRAKIQEFRELGERGNTGEHGQRGEFGELCIFLLCVKEESVGQWVQWEGSGLRAGGCSRAVGGELHGGASPLQIVVAALGPAS